MLWTFQPHPLTWLIVIEIGVLLVCLIQTVRRPLQFGQASLLIFIGLNALWLLTYATLATSSRQDTAFLWGKIEFSFRIFIPVLWFMLIYDLTNPEMHWRINMTPPVRALLLVIPMISIVLLWTNNLHNLFAIQDVQLVMGFPVLNTVGPKPFVLLYAWYSFFMQIIGVTLLIASIHWGAAAHTSRSSILLTIWLVVAALETLDTPELTERIGIQISPFIMGIAITVTWWALYRTSWAEVVSFARNHIIDVLPDGIIIFDIHNTVLDINPTACDLIGVQASSTIGQKAERVFAGIPEITTANLSGARAHTNIKYLRENIPLVFEIRIMPLYDDRQTPLGRVVLVRDITSDKQASEVLRTSLVRTHVLYQTSNRLLAYDSLPVLLNNIVTTIVEALSPYLVIMLRMDTKTGDVINYVQAGPGANASDPLSVQDMLAGLVGHVMRTGEIAVSAKKDIPDPRQPPHVQQRREALGFGSVVVVPLKHHDMVLGAILVVNRMEERDFEHQDAELMLAIASQASIAMGNAQLMETVQDYAAELEERNKELDTYSHSVAHDLKKPLIYLLGYSELLEDDESLPQDTRTQLQHIRASAQQMNKMIDGLLMLATLRSAEGIIVPTNLTPLIDLAVAQHQDQIEDRKIRLSIADDMPLVMGESKWLEVAFINLLSNAIKYIGKDNPDPHIIITAKRHNGRVNCKVRDNGIGISLDDQENLFEMFSRFHIDEAEGHGIGLSIVQRVIARLNGTIGVESSPGMGTTVWFELPAANNDTSPH